MAIKRKDFQKLADAVNEFQKKLTEGTECAELRDALNLALFLMQKHYRFLQLKMRDQTKQKPLYPNQTNQPGQFANNIKVSDDNKFEWTWISGDASRMIESLPLAKRTLQTPVPFIVQAAKDGELNMIRQLIEKDPNCVNDVDSYGRTALFYCIHYGQINTMAVLLQCGANPEIACNEGSLPLHMACCYGNAAAADLLLHNHQPDSINYQDSYGRSAVHWAMVPTTTDCLRLLIRCGAILGLRDKQGLSPAMWACRKDGLQHLQLLLQVGLSTSEPDGIERDEQGLTWLHWAVLGGTECFTALMDETTVQLRDKLGRTAFLFAAEKGCIDVLKVIRERVSRDRLLDVDNFGRSALHLATMNGQGRIAGFLLDCGISPETRDKDNLTAIDYAKSRQLNYCLRVFAAHLSATAQPNYRPPNKPIGNIASFSPFGTIGEPSPIPAAGYVENGDKNNSLPPRMRPPLSETPSFVPKPPPHPNRVHGPDGGIPARLIQSTDQMDSTPITTLQPTPPPRDGRRNNRMSHRRGQSLGNRNNGDYMSQTLPLSHNQGSTQMAVDQASMEHEQSVPRPSNLVNQPQSLQRQPQSRSSSMSRIDSAHYSQQDQQVAMEQYSSMEHMQPNEQDADVTVGVAPLTAETLAYQQQILHQQYLKQLSRESSHDDASSRKTVLMKHPVVHDENIDDAASMRSVHAERAEDDDASSHDSTADTVVLSPSKQHGTKPHRHHQPRNQQFHPLESGPRPFLASAKQHISRDDMNGDESTPPPSKIPILSSPPLQNHNYNQQQPQWGGHPYAMQPIKAQHLGSDHMEQSLQYQQPQQLPPPQIAPMPVHAPLPPPWAHLPPVQVSKNLPIPPSLDDDNFSSSTRQNKPRKTKSKRANHASPSQFIAPLQPRYGMQPPSLQTGHTPPPPQPSPSSLLPASAFPMPQNSEGQHQDYYPQPQHQHHQNLYRQRSDSYGRRRVETEQMDQMESEAYDGNIHQQTGVGGFVSPSSPVLGNQSGAHRPPSRRGISNEERERAMIANNLGNDQLIGSPAVRLRRSRQNAPVLSPSPTGNMSPQLRHQENNRSNSPVENLPMQNRSRPQSRGKTSESLPTAIQPIRSSHRSSPVISTSLVSSPIPMLTHRNAHNKSAANSDNESASRPASSERPESPPPALTFTPSNRRRGRIDLH